MSLEKLTNLFVGKEEKEAARHRANVQRYLDMEMTEKQNPDQLSPGLLEKMRHLDSDTVPDRPYSSVLLNKEFEEARQQGGGEIKDLEGVLNNSADKLVPFGGEINSERNETGAISRETLAELSEKWRHYLTLPFNADKGRMFLDMEQSKQMIKKIFGAREVIFGFDGDISIIYPEGKIMKIFDNPGLPVKDAITGPAEEVLAVLDEKPGKNQPDFPANEETADRDFSAANFNINEPFTDVETARTLAADVGYLDLSKVPACSREFLLALQNKEGMINLTGLKADKVSEEMIRILANFKSTLFLADDIRKKVDESVSV